MKNISNNTKSPLIKYMVFAHLYIMGWYIAK